MTGEDEELVLSRAMAALRIASIQRLLSRSVGPIETDTTSYRQLQCVDPPSTADLPCVRMSGVSRVVSLPFGVRQDLFAYPPYPGRLVFRG
jgi:hypothetical protein